MQRHPSLSVVFFFWQCTANHISEVRSTKSLNSCSTAFFNQSSHTNSITYHLPRRRCLGLLQPNPPSPSQLHSKETMKGMAGFCLLPRVCLLWYLWTAEKKMAPKINWLNSLTPSKTSTDNRVCSHWWRTVKNRLNKVDLNQPMKTLPVTHKALPLEWLTAVKNETADCNFN